MNEGKDLPTMSSPTLDGTTNVTDGCEVEKVQEEQDIQKVKLPETTDISKNQIKPAAVGESAQDQQQEISKSNQISHADESSEEVNEYPNGMKRLKNKSTKTEKEMDDGKPEVAKSIPAAAIDLHTSYRYDVVLWLFGLLFIIVLHSLMFGIGAARGWDAPSAYDHELSNNSMERFLPEPFKPELGVYKRSDKDASSRWYYWKLKPEHVTAWTTLFAWVGYSLHNLSVWLVLYLQHKSKNFPDGDGKYPTRYTKTPDKYNLILFGLNVFFHLLHLVNTHTTYDGTAADTSEASSQSSVIVALIIILFIEFRDRGVFFGYPSPHQLRKYQDSVWMSPVYLFRKYHGYFIYWGAIFTFWYHPMENTVGHAFGFTHTWFLMLQGSLAFTQQHLNKYWRFTLEVWVTIHAGVVAVQTVPNVMGKEIWPMFVFGFATAIILTQLYGLPFWKNIPAWSRALPAAIFTVIVVTAYNFIRDKEGRRFTRLQEIIRIPGIYYLLLLVGWLLIAAISKIQQVYYAKQANNSIDSLHEIEKKIPKVDTRPPIWKEVICLLGVLLTYIFSVFLSWILEYLDLKVNLIVLTMIYSFSFLVFSAILGSFLLKMVLPMQNIPTDHHRSK